MDQPADRRWLPLAEVANALGVSVDTLRRHIRKGALPARRERDGPGPLRWVVPLGVALEVSGITPLPPAAAVLLSLIQSVRSRVDALSDHTKQLQTQLERLEALLDPLP